MTPSYLVKQVPPLWVGPKCSCLLQSQEPRKDLLCPLGMQGGVKPGVIGNSCT